MKIIECTASHDEEWNRFVTQFGQASFYHRAEWRQINEECLGHRTSYLAAVDDTTIVGVFPLVRLKSLLFGNLACSMPFVNLGGPAAINPDVDQALMQAAVKKANHWGVDYVEIRSRRYLGPDYPVSEHKVSMTVPLGPDPEALFNAFDRDHRREIRKSQTNGFVVRFGGEELVDDFYSVMSESWRNLGTPIFPKSYISAICRAFPGAIRICVVSTGEGVPVATAFDGLHGTTVEGMWLGIKAEYRRPGAGLLLYWELIKNACETGFMEHHLGRSSANSGAEQFKKKWNAVTVQLYWHYILRNRSEIPALNVSNPRYQFAIKMWQKLPLAASQLIGPLIARSIP